MANLSEHKANLLQSEAEALVNTVNCVGVMGKGIALQFKQAYPDNFRAYSKACQKGEVQLGKTFTVPTNGLINPKYIINFPTKHHWREKSKIHNIEKGLAELVAEIQRLGIRSIAVPPLGCGNGGLNWGEVKPLIEAAFSQLPDQVQVLVYPPQDAPAAERMPIATKKPKMTRARAIFIQLIKAYGQLDYKLSMLEVQKLGYLIQASGEPLKLNYVKYKYGPYAENLNHALQRLEGHYIRGYGDRSREPKIRLEPGAYEESDEVLNSHPDTKKRIERVKKLIEGYEFPYGMELLSTVLWVTHEDPDAKKDVQKAIELTHSWNERKRKTMNRRDIKLAFQRLQEHGFLS